MKPFEPWLNRPGLKTVHGFHGSNQSIKKKLVNLLLLACLSVTLCILSLFALRSSISCLSIKFGSFFLSDREERATWDRENERSCWQKKKKKGRRKKRTEIHKHTAEDAQVQRRIEIHLRSWALIRNFPKKKYSEVLFCKMPTLKYFAWRRCCQRILGNWALSFYINTLYFSLFTLLVCPPTKKRD